MNLQLGFSFLAGLLTTLSPCVLPILPFLLGSAARKNKKAPMLMILGLSIGFIVVGLVISRFGTILGLDNDQLRKGSALLLMATSVLFLSSRLQDLISSKMTSFSNIGSSSASKWKLDETSSWDSFLLGLLLGVIWSPCAGPTLGVAISLASQEGGIFEAFKIMLIYVIGASIPMLLIAYGLRSFFQKHQARIISFAKNSKSFFGIILLLTGVSIFFGLDKILETILLDHLPDFWVNLITKY